MKINQEQYKQILEKLTKIEKALNGGKGSGNFGHSGRPGRVGGSGDGSGVERFLFNGEIPSQNPQPTKDGYVVLHHNTDNENADSINQEGLVAGRNLGAYQISPEEGMGIWTDNRAKKDGSYGGCTISFQVPAEEAKKFAVNDTQHLIPHNIAREDIVCIDKIICSQGKGGEPIKVSNLKANVDFYVGKGLDEKKVIGIIARNSHGGISEQEIKKIIDGGYKKAVKNGGPGSGNFGHSGRPGKVGGSGKGSLAESRMAKGVKEYDPKNDIDGGFTVGLNDNKSYRLGQSEGYAVGGFGTERVVSMEDWNNPKERKKILKEYYEENAKALAQEGACLGGWVPTKNSTNDKNIIGKVVLDVSRVFTDKREAAKQAIKTDQDSITDFKAFDWPTKDQLAKEFGLEKELAKSRGKRAKERG